MDDLKILVYSGDYGDSYWDISTPELEAAAYLELFKYLNEECKVYTDLTEVDEPAEVVDDHVKGCKCGRCDLFDVAAQKRSRDLETKRKARQLDLYTKATNGDKAAAKALILLRKTYEYEEVHNATVRRAT